MGDLPKDTWAICRYQHGRSAEEHLATLPLMFPASGRLMRCRSAPPADERAGVLAGPAAGDGDQACRTRLVALSRNSAARDRDLPSSGISAQPMA
jgi:hypothetical protein